MSFNCSIVADSKNMFGNRLTTYLLTFPRYILAELNTHRAFTRNSASSRAIPFKKAVASVKRNPYVPEKWMKDHSGMQGSIYFQTRFKKWILRTMWLLAMRLAVLIATCLHKAGLTKQFCNRLIEPFMWHTALVTASEFENFFFLRAHPQADINIQRLAFMMLQAYNDSVPIQLNQGEWHMPFVDSIDPMKLSYLLAKLHPDETVDHYKWINYAIKICTAKCARTSYTVVGQEEKKPDYLADISLHDRLAESGHWSPFEHIAKPMTNEEYLKFTRTQPLGFEEPHNLSGDSILLWDGVAGRSVTASEGMDVGVEHGWCGNFRGFIQYRKYFADENKSDNRVKKVVCENL